MFALHREFYPNSGLRLVAYICYVGAFTWIALLAFFK